MKCIVLAAGYATRLYPLTENFPKPLLEVKGKSILDWLLEDVQSTNMVDEVLADGSSEAFVATVVDVGDTVSVPP